MKTPIFLLGIFLLIISCNSAAKISLLKDNNDAVFANHVSYDASRRGSLIFKNEKDKIAQDSISKILLKDSISKNNTN